MKAYFPSTAPGKTWSVSFYKPQGAPGYVSATEGEHEVSATGFSCFKFLLFDPATRRFKATITGPCTAKKKAAAFDTLVAGLKAHGYVAADAKSFT